MIPIDVNYTKLQALLDKVGVIDFKYKKTRQKTSFNVFNLLNRKFDEVHLHSRFIYELLCPKGSHGFGIAFLKLFCGGLKIDFNLEDILVYREYKNIDILIRNTKQAIVIENKLYAADQFNQLQRYYDILKSEGIDDIRIVYLSIDGKEPELHSIGNLINLKEWPSIFLTISYNFEIDEWIHNCIKEAYNLPSLRETLIQYKLLINEISGKTMNNEEREEILALLAVGDNIIQAKKIAENWVHVKWHTEWDFWNDLQEVISTEFHILDRCKFTSEKLNGVIHKSRNRFAWYGIMFKINEFEGCDLCLFIERGWEDVYFGITAIRNDDREINKDPIFNELVEKLKEISEWGQENTWLGGNYCEPRINFELFSNNTTLRLLNPKERAIYISNLWMQIKEYVKGVNQLITGSLDGPATPTTTLH